MKIAPGLTKTPPWILIGPSEMMQVAPAGTVTVPYVPGASVLVHVVPLVADDETVIAMAARAAVNTATTKRRIVSPLMLFCLSAAEHSHPRKSSKSAFVRSGWSSWSQWLAPSMRSYRHGPDTCSADRIIRSATRELSPLLQRPSVG